MHWSSKLSIHYKIGIRTVSRATRRRSQIEKGRRCVISIQHKYTQEKWELSFSPFLLFVWSVFEPYYRNRVLLRRGRKTGKTTADRINQSLSSRKLIGSYHSLFGNSSDRPFQCRMWAKTVWMPGSGPHCGLLFTFQVHFFSSQSRS